MPDSRPARNPRALGTLTAQNTDTESAPKRVVDLVNFGARSTRMVTFIFFGSTISGTTTVNILASDGSTWVSTGITFTAAGIGQLELPRDAQLSIAIGAATTPNVTVAMI